MKFRRAVPEPGRVEKIKHSVQCHAEEARHRVRAGIGDATPKVKSTVANVTANVSGTAHDVAHNAAGMAQSAASTASSAAHTAADRAHIVADRTRPLRDEAVSRGPAAWSILRNGTPRKQSLAAGVAAAPLAAVGKVGSTMRSKRNSALALAAAGGAAAMGVLWWRRSHADTEGMWISEPGTTDDEESHAGWHENPGAGDAKGGVSAGDKPVDCVDPETCRDSAHTWP